MLGHLPITLNFQGNLIPFSGLLRHLHACVRCQKKEPGTILSYDAQEEKSKSFKSMLNWGWLLSTGGVRGVTVCRLWCLLSSWLLCQAQNLEPSYLRLALSENTVKANTFSWTQSLRNPFQTWQILGWRHRPDIPALGGGGSREGREFKANLSYIPSLRSAWVTWDSVSKLILKSTGKMAYQTKH